MNTFIGESRKLRPLADEVLEQIKKVRPDIIVTRKSGPHTISVITDRDFFIRLMQEKGVDLREPNILDIQLGDLSLSNTSLTNLFVGSLEKIKPMANEVLIVLRAQNPTLIAERRNGTTRVTVVTNQDLFIQEMITRGIQLKTQDILEIQPTDFSTSAKTIADNFRGSYNTKLKGVVNEVLQVLEAENPMLLAERRNGNLKVTVVTDRERFIQEMEKRGIKFKKKD